MEENYRMLQVPCRMQCSCSTSLHRFPCQLACMVWWVQSCLFYCIHILYMYVSLPFLTVDSCLPKWRSDCQPCTLPCPSICRPHHAARNHQLASPLSPLTTTTTTTATTTAETTGRDGIGEQGRGKALWSRETNSLRYCDHHMETVLLHFHHFVRL